MLLRTLAHLSDLHLDLTRESDRLSRALVETLLAERVDHVVVTGDLTHQGSRSEYRRFRELFAPLLEAGRLTFIPGNHCPRRASRSGWPRAWAGRTPRSSRWGPSSSAGFRAGAI